MPQIRAMAASFIWDGPSHPRSASPSV
jgi:hypothetical protein